MLKAVGNSQLPDFELCTLRANPRPCMSSAACSQSNIGGEYRLLRKSPNRNIPHDPRSSPPETCTPSHSSQGPARACTQPTQLRKPATGGATRNATSLPSSHKRAWPALVSTFLPRICCKRTLLAPENPSAWLIPRHDTDRQDLLSHAGHPVMLRPV